MDLDDALQECLTGGAVLFCGAGFSANSLNFGNVEIGTGYPLLKLLNTELGYEFDDLHTAADDFVETRGNHALMLLLKERYQVVNIPQSNLDILKYPWDIIYTTNYDDSIALSLQKLNKKYRRFNNLDCPPESGKGNCVDIVHLHGCVETWDDYNFQESCVLGAQSYYKNDLAGRWKNRLEDDYNYCKCFFFVGFSARDYYLNRVFFNATASSEKVFS
jgi:hypothetical protein